MGFFDMFKKKAKEEVGQVVDKVQEMPKDQLVEDAANALKKVTPDSIDAKIDEVATKIEDKVQ